MILVYKKFSKCERYICMKQNEKLETTKQLWPCILDPSTQVIFFWQFSESDFLSGQYIIQQLLIQRLSIQTFSKQFPCPRLAGAICIKEAANVSTYHNNMHRSPLRSMDLRKNSSMFKHVVSCDLITSFPALKLLCIVKSYVTSGRNKVRSRCQLIGMCMTSNA